MQLEFDDQEMKDLQNLFNELDPEETIFMSHYQLATATGTSAERWKAFLIHPKVNTWISHELALFKEYQLKQMIRSATDNDKSVGAAQMINSLTKTLQESGHKEGPIIIYTHVPLTDEMKSGTTIESIELDENILENLQAWEED